MDELPITGKPLVLAVTATKLFWHG